ncbi:MAG: hypothetical protein KAI47_09070, partial [Deltaproteobacteria bacterium]|nr:hypothetical protein [Deltaproteobacteria bacterium]
MALSIAACSDDTGGNNNGTKADNQTSKLVAKDVSTVTNTVGEQAGAKAGQIDIGLTGDKLSGAITGSAGTVQVTGSVKSGANGFDITSKLDFQDFEGAAGIAITGTVESIYKLTVDVTNPMSPQIKFSSQVKGHLVTGDGKVVDIDMTVTADQGQLTCGGSANGVPVDADCQAGSVPTPDSSGTTPDGGGTTPDVGGTTPDVGG